jgi:DNA-binding transcriptional MerR regulator
MIRLEAAHGTDLGERLFCSTGEASRLVGVSPHTLRYWEKRLRLVTYRSPGGRRLYRAADLAALKRVAALLRQGYGLKAVRERLKLGEPGTPPGTRALKSLREDLAGLAEILSGGNDKEGGQ